MDGWMGRQRQADLVLLLVATESCLSAAVEDVIEAPISERTLDVICPSIHESKNQNQKKSHE